MTNSLREQQNMVIKEFAKRGIRVEIGGCGCCDSPWVKVEVDKEIILDNSGVSIDMFEGDVQP